MLGRRDRGTDSRDGSSRGEIDCAARARRSWPPHWMSGRPVAGIFMIVVSVAACTPSHRPHEAATTIDSRQNPATSRTSPHDPTAAHTAVPDVASTSGGGSVIPPAPRGTRVKDAQFDAGGDSWLLGDGRCQHSGKNNCPTLLRVVDGAWRSVPLPSGLTSTFDFGSCGSNGEASGPCVDRVAFAAADGYLWSERESYWTSDAGHVWHQDTQSFTIDLAISQGRAVRIAVTQHCLAGCSKQVQTAPAGTDAWTAPSGYANSLVAAAGPDSLINAAGAVYLVGYQSADASGGTVLSRSRDGGQTWSSARSRLCPEFPVNSYPFYPVIAPGGAIAADCEGEGQHSVTVLPDFNATSGPRREVPIGNQSSAIVAVADPNRLIAQAVYSTTGPDFRARTYLSLDGGSTWALVPSAGTALWTRAGFVTATNGWAINDAGRLLLTHDGGTTWS